MQRRNRLGPKDLGKDYFENKEEATTRYQFLTNSLTNTAVTDDRATEIRSPDDAKLRVTFWLLVSYFLFICIFYSGDFWNKNKFSCRHQN